MANLRAVRAVEARRKQLGLRQEAMAKALGMRQSHYSEMVHGKRGLPRKSMSVAYRFFKIPADDLLLEDYND